LYDKQSKQFIINTPDFEAAKCWVGNLGKTASMVLLFANLLTPDGENHCLHGFLVPVRDPLTLKHYDGVVVGDIGEKIGLNGVDNGFIMFDNFRIPKVNLLNRIGDVNDEGEYESVFTEPKKMLRKLSSLLFDMLRLENNLVRIKKAMKFRSSNIH